MTRGGKKGVFENEFSESWNLKPFHDIELNENLYFSFRNLMQMIQAINPGMDIFNAYQ